MITFTHAERVERGAAVFDRKFPGWLPRINLHSLDVSNGCTCPVGQLCGDYCSGLSQVLGDEELRQGSVWSYGFNGNDQQDLDELTKAWREYIIRRRIREFSPDEHDLPIMEAVLA